jgi:uncharacterized protein involved in exopolysaccharide biosynthesis
MASKDEGAFWNIISYLIAGMGFWGAAGALLDNFLKTQVFVFIGIFLGLFLSIYLIWVRYVRSDPSNLAK